VVGKDLVRKSQDKNGLTDYLNLPFTPALKYSIKLIFHTGHIIVDFSSKYQHKKHLKNVGPIRHNEPPHAHSADVASGTVARRLRIDVHDDNDNDNA